MSVTSPSTAKVGKSAYSTIVYQDGDLCVAEDNVGTIIKENTDDATVIQAAIDDLTEGTLFIAKGDYSIPSANININTSSHRIDIVGEGRGGQNVENGTRLVFSNAKGIYMTGTGWHNKISNIGLIGDGSGKAISNDSPASNFNYYTFENIGIKNFATGIELNKAMSPHFRNILIWDATKGIRLPGQSWSPYLENISTGYGAGSEEGIYMGETERATLINCDGGDATTFTYQLNGFGLVLISPYSESASGPMRLSGTNIIVRGGYVNSNVYLCYEAGTYNVNLDMVNYYNRETISFTIGTVHGCGHVLIDTGAWSPTVTDTNHRALVRSTVPGDDQSYFKFAGAGCHYNDLLAIPTALPTYGLRAGTMYFDTSTKALKIYDGAAWKSVTLT